MCSTFELTQCTLTSMEKMSVAEGQGLAVGIQLDQGHQLGGIKMMKEIGKTSSEAMVLEFLCHRQWEQELWRQGRQSQQLL